MPMDNNPSSPLASDVGQDQTQELRRELQQQQQQARQQQAQQMEEILSRVADNMKQEDNDIRDDHRRHQDLKTSLTDLQQQLASILQ